MAEYGILTPIKNVEKMKEAMNLIIDDDNLRKDYEEKAKQRANDFKIETIIKQYEKIINAWYSKYILCFNYIFNY